MSESAHVLDILEERGFVEQTTHDQELRDYLSGIDATCYIGFDPTADSLHVGSLIPIMSLAHMQRQGGRAIALVGGGTGLVGDPSGKTEMRKLLTPDLVSQNARGIQRQLERFLDFSAGRALMVNNADWLTELKYIPFLRDIGRHFSVNRMIKAESYRVRIDSEEGLNFIEFNYMLLQAYDFLELFNRHRCRLQMGGSDQWGNIVAGVDLIRRMCQEPAFGITFPLITTASGAKMGKTAKGAVWLNPIRTSPYEYYQFWVNTEDGDVARFLKLFTFLPVDEIDRVADLDGAQLNIAKTILAFEATALAHGAEEALRAYAAACEEFGKREVDGLLMPSSIFHQETDRAMNSSTPTTALSIDELQAGIPAFKLFAQVCLTDSSSAARRLVQQGGAYLNGERITTVDHSISMDDMVDGQIVLKAGKKKIHKIIAES